MDKETKFDNLPEVLKKDAGFLLWRYENVKNRRTKVPYSIRGTRTDATRRDSYSTYSSVISTYAEGGYDGIGIFIDRTFSAVDIDISSFLI